MRVTRIHIPPKIALPPARTVIYSIVHAVIVALIIFPVSVVAQDLSGVRSASDRISDFKKTKKLAYDGVSLQRFAILPQTNVFTLQPNSPPVRFTGYCLDEDLPAPKPEEKVEYKYAHTLGQRFVKVNTNAPISFEEALGNRADGPAVLRVKASSLPPAECRVTHRCFYLEFENVSKNSLLTIQFPQASVFGRSEGKLDRQNLRDAQLLRLLDDPALAERPLSQLEIWNATARLSRLRRLGFWPRDRPLDAVTSEVQDQAEIMAQRRLGVSSSGLDNALADRAANAPPRYIVTLRPSGTGFVRIRGVTVSEVRLRGSHYDLEQLFHDDSFLQYSNSGYEMEIREQPPAPPGPRGGSGGGSSGGPPISAELNANDFSAVAQKAQEDGCSIEYCVSVAAGSQTAAPKDGNVEQKASLECRGVGFGLSTKGKAELKLGLISISTPN